MRVLLTGATGFVGRAVEKRLREAGHELRLALRRPWPESSRLASESVIVGDIGPATDWRAAVEGCEAVVHLAAHVHQVSSNWETFHAVNVDGTEALASAAVRAGVSRFVYMSTVKVHGERSVPLPGGGWHRYVESDTPNPVDDYGKSKLAGEEVLQRVCAGSETVSVILRPVLVYGPGVRANFARLMRIVALGLPLPLGAVRNLRSLVYVRNLADVVERALSHPGAAGRRFLVSDLDISTPDLLRAVGAAMGKPVRLVRVPVGLLRAAASIAGRSDAIARLTESLIVDSSALRSTLGWAPAIGLESAVAETVSAAREVHVWR